jgi:hypothetical protein
MNHPTLLNSCARAATAAEARFRIPIAPVVPRSTRVIALDPPAAELIARIADEPWRAAHFLRYDSADGQVAADGAVIDVLLRTPLGEPVRLSSELDDADFVMMVATADDGAAVALAVGAACTLRGIMSAGVVVARGSTAERAVSALRPHSRVLLVSDDQDDISEILSAVGA